MELSALYCDSPEGGADFPAGPFSVPENAQTLAGVAFCAAGKSGNNFPAASRFAGKLFQQRISDSHSLLEFSEFSVWVTRAGVLYHLLGAPRRPRQ